MNHQTISGMSNPDPGLARRLAGAAIAAVLLISALLPLWGAGLGGGIFVGNRPTAPKPAHHDPPPKDRQVDIGSPRSQVASVAWVSWEDFRQLEAPQSQTRQPAVQQQVEPTPDAPLELDPTPDVVAAANQHAAEPPMTQADSLPAPGAGDPELTPQFHVHNQPRIDFQHHNAPADRDHPSDIEHTATSTGDPSARPTAAPRGDMQSPPAQPDEPMVRVQPGQVVTAQGIQLNPAMPDIALVARLTSRPHANPQATLTFDTDGVVIQVELTRSTGLDNWDGPIVSSLYRWRAVGDGLEDKTEPFQRHVTIILDPDLPN